MRTFAPLFALTTLLAALPAQVTVSPFRFVPADSTVVRALLKASYLSVAAVVA